MDAKELCVKCCKTNQVCVISTLRSTHLVKVSRRYGHNATLHVCNAIMRSLAVLLFTGVQSVDIDLAQQKVLVKGDVSQEDILQTVSKTGKKTELWQ